jgi:hypothetical protein
MAIQIVGAPALTIWGQILTLRECPAEVDRERGHHQTLFDAADTRANIKI